MTERSTRRERDSLGELEVPAGALYGAQTQRAVLNFPLSGRPLPQRFIAAVCTIKQAAAAVNHQLGLLDAGRAQAIAEAACAVRAQFDPGQFPVDVFQTGSGTSTNMNVNEVLATLAARRLGEAVSPNDHVNLGQSSNDVIPSAIHLSAALALHEQLLPALGRLAETIDARGAEWRGLVKTGRTHLMDAMPLTLGQELSGWSAQVRACEARLRAVLPRLTCLALGATAVGTGVNAHPDFAAAVSAELSRLTGLALQPSENFFAALAGQDTAVELSGQLKTFAVALMKIANDLRWMNSGPLAGLGEVVLPALQPGSSIMPGKVNPVIPEAVAMVAAEVIGNDTTVALAGQSGNFQLNVMLPLIALKLLEGIERLANAADALGERAIAGMQARADNLAATLDRNPVLVTALNPVIGYLRAAEIARTAYAEGRPVIEVAERMTELSRAELERLLDPWRLTGGDPDA